MARFEVTSVKSLTELSNSEYNLMRSLRLKTQSDFGHKNLQIVHFTCSPSYSFFMEDNNAIEITYRFNKITCTSLLSKKNRNLVKVL